MVSSMPLNEIAKVLKESESIAIIIHKNPDSDCLGSSTALLLALKQLGKTAHIFVDGSVPQRLKIYGDDSFFNGKKDMVYDVCVALDVASFSQMGSVKEEVYDISKIKCSIDHHGTNKGFADINYVDASSGAAGEILYKFIKDHLCAQITDEIAMRLYGAISADTGSFQYSNTTSETHKIASELLNFNFDAPGLMRILFENKTYENLKLRAEVTDKLRFYEDGKICVAKVDETMLTKYNMTFEDADDIVSLPRSITGVEVGVYIKVKATDECKVSLRSNEYVDVASVAKKFGGGGHIKAAGVTFNTSSKEAEKIIVDAIKKVL